MNNRLECLRTGLARGFRVGHERRVGQRLGWDYARYRNVFKRLRRKPIKATIKALREFRQTGDLEPLNRLNSSVAMSIEKKFGKMARNGVEREARQGSS